MSSGHSKNSASTPIASTSRAMVSTDNENTGMMGPPKTSASAPTDGYLDAFVESVIKEVMCIPHAMERNEARAKLDKFISDRANETITSEGLESESDMSSSGDSDLSRRIMHNIGGKIE